MKPREWMQKKGRQWLIGALSGRFSQANQYPEEKNDYGALRSHSENGGMDHPQRSASSDHPYFFPTILSPVLLAIKNGSV